MLTRTFTSDARKAVKNRKRDLEAHHEHVHDYNPRTIAGGVLLVNAAPRFQSPLRGSVTTHRDPAALVAHCLSEVRAIGMRGGTSVAGLDAKTLIVVDYDNMGGRARYIEHPPAPRVGDQVHYDAFIQRLCGEYESRW